MTQDHVLRFPFGSVSAICSPRSPASRRANGSRKSASLRSLSRARYTAAQRAVSEMFRIRGSLPMFSSVSAGLLDRALVGSGEVPGRAEGILHGAGPSVGLIRRCLGGNGARAQRPLVERIHALDVEEDRG